MFGRLWSRSVSAVSRQWRGFASGVVVGLTANWIFLVATSHVDNKRLQQDTLRELSSRLIATHQTMTHSLLRPTAALAELENMYSNTRSSTGDSRFEGRRLENLIYDLERNSDGALKEMLNRIRYLRNYAPLFFQEADEQTNNKSARELVSELGDYYCCLSAEIGAEALMCKPYERYFTGSHYCIHTDGQLAVAPWRTRIQRVYPVQGD